MSDLWEADDTSQCLLHLLAGLPGYIPVHNHCVSAKAGSGENEAEPGSKESAFGRAAYRKKGKETTRHVSVGSKHCSG
ncbi:MAG: hypothetical protein LKG17_07600 [Megasphaera sp.]|nr:hypothetical protein [Megasphaera sp.]